MGLLCSGEISDLALYGMMELPTVLNPGFREKFGIIGYMRFKDDLLMVVDSTKSQRREMVGEMRRHSRFFRLKVESIGQEETTFLDLRIYRGVRWQSTRKLDTSLYRKETSLWVPLSHASHHHPSVHKWWPLSEIRRIHSRCSSSFEANQLERCFRHDLKVRCGQHPALIHSPPRSNPSKQSTRTWIVLPYRVEWARAHIAHVFREIGKNLNPQVQRYIPGIAWRLSGKHLVHRVRGLSASER